MNKFLVSLCSILLVIGLAYGVHAAPITAVTIGGDIEDHTSIGTGGTGALGFTFYVNSPVDILVTHLGVFDGSNGENGSPGDGLTESHDVGIYEATGGLNRLVMDTVPSGSGPAENYFHYVELASPFQLETGKSYYVLAMVGTERYMWNPPTASWSSPGVNYLEYAEVDGMGALETDLVGESINPAGGPSVGYFGPNFKYSAVPIPGAIWLLGSGLLGLVGLRRKFK